jgi:hypothetical protein
LTIGATPGAFARAHDGVANGLIEVLADDTTRWPKTQLGTPAKELYPWLHEQLAGSPPEYRTRQAAHRFCSVAHATLSAICRSWRYPAAIPV